VNAKISDSQTPLQQAARIAHLERGKLSIIREGPSGPFYNHQYRQDGKNKTRYVPRDQVESVQKAIDGYAQFKQLIAQHVDQVVQTTRAEISSDSKKNSSQSPANSSWPKKRKSAS
jgi:hypothetical protein